MKKLEDHKIFPYIAWILVIGFAAFTYDLSTRVSSIENTLNDRQLDATIHSLDAMFEERAE